jgi:hypothetical protein
MVARGPLKAQQALFIEGCCMINGIAATQCVVMRRDVAVARCPRCF